MNRSDALDLLAALEARYPAFPPASEMTEEAFYADLADLPAGLVTVAAMALLYEEPGRVPASPAIRRRAMVDAGLLAPPWDDAYRMVSEAAAGLREWASLPGPVQVITKGDLGMEWMKPVEERYQAAATEHDRRVMAPGGVAELAAAAEWVAAVERLAELRAVARNCQASDVDVFVVGGDMTAEDAEAVIAGWKVAHPGEELPGAGYVFEGVPLAGPVKALLDRLCGLRSLAAGGRP